MEVTVTVYNIPITRGENNEVEVHDDQKVYLTNYKVDLEDISRIEKLTKELNQDFKAELNIAKHNKSKITVKKKIITN